MNYDTLDVKIWSQNKKCWRWNKKLEIWLVNKDHDATSICEGRLKSNIVNNIVCVTFKIQSKFSENLLYRVVHPKMNILPPLFKT